MFQFRQEQFAALRRKKIGDGLIATFADGPVRATWSNQQTYVIASDPLKNQTRFGFDEQGFIAAIASPMGRLWQIANYPDGKPALFKNPAGHQLGLTYTANGQLSAITSDGKPRLQLHYNERHKAIAASFPDGTYSAAEYTPWSAPLVVTNRMGLSDVCDYDEHRRLTALTDGNGSRTEFLYSVWSRPDTTVFPNGTSESYKYSKNGFVTKIATEETEINLEPDDTGRPVQLVYNDGIEISYKYDDQGRAVEAIRETGEQDPPHISRYAYNDAGLLESEQSGNAALLYEYDQAARLIGLTYPTGEKVAYEWDADSRLTLVRDWNGGEHRIQYATHDRGSLLTYPNGLETLTILNNLGRPESIAVSAKGNPLFSLGYTYDNEDRIATLRDSAFGYRDFRYDSESQLIAADSQGDSPTESFTYDGSGNPLDLSGKSATYDPANQLLALGHSRYDHDRRGNLTIMDTAEGIWRFTWNALNQMIASQSPSGAITTYAYDAFGRRILKQREGRTTEFQWAGEQMIAEIITTPEAISRLDYLYYPGTFTPLAVRVDGQIYSYHCDHLGTPRMVSAPDGTMVWLADYTSFGQARIAHESFRNPLRAPGQYFDEETGLHYNRFRYYSPPLARYLSRDPASYYAGFNFYKYSSNNPINSADPLGLWDWPSSTSIAKAAAFVGSVAAGVALTIALAPIAIPLAIVAGGALAGAIGFGLNEYIDNGFCASCIAKAAVEGAVVGAIASLPFVAAAALGLTGAAAVTAMGIAGALGGAVSYTAAYGIDKLRGKNVHFSGSKLGKSAGIGLVLGIAGGLLMPALAARAVVPVDEVEVPSTETADTDESDVDTEDSEQTGSLTGQPTKIPPNSDAATARSLTRENESAQILAKNGYNVEQNPSVDGPKNPDYRINGEIYDNYAPETSNVRNIASTVDGKVQSGQADNVVINLADSNASAADIQSQLTNYPIDGLNQVIIIDQSQNLTVIGGE